MVGQFGTRQIPLLFFTRPQTLKRANFGCHENLSDFHVGISCNFLIMEPCCFSRAAGRLALSGGALPCVLRPCKTIRDLQGTGQLCLDFQLHVPKSKMCVSCFLSLKKKYIFGSFFFFFLPPNKRMLKMALETWREALFKWYCVLLYLFLHGKLHWKFKLIIEQGQSKHVRFLEN